MKSLLSFARKLHRRTLELLFGRVKMVLVPVRVMVCHRPGERSRVRPLWYD